MKTILHPSPFLILPAFMSRVYAHISNAPLREAIAEQVKACGLGELCLLESVDRLPQIQDYCALLVLSRGADQLVEDVLARLEKKDNRPAVLVLGDGGEHVGIAETFPLPLRLGHLMTRLKYFLETAPLLADSQIIFGPYSLDPQARSVLRDGEDEPIRLTEKETALLVFLAQRKTPVSRQELLANVWGYDDRIDTHTLETHIYLLRRKLDKEGESWLINDSGNYRLAEIK